MTAAQTTHSSDQMPLVFDRRAKRPFTGAEYLSSLRDGRCVYFDGEMIRDVTAHPALSNTARSVARLYDELHRPEAREQLCWETDTGSEGYTHKFFRCARSAADLREQREAIAAWARLSYGWLARPPDYKGAFSCSLGMNPAFYGDFAQNARAWYGRIQESCLYMNHAIVTPLDRQNGALRPLFTVDRETDGGIFVSGAKMVATNAALNQAIFISHVAGPLKGAAENTSVDYGSAFVVAAGAPGVKLLLRSSYEFTARSTGRPYDNPLSSRFDENDAVLILDHVFVPWENVLIYRDPARCRAWYDELFAPVFPLHACVRLAVRLDFITALHRAALECTGKLNQPGVKARLGEVVAWRNLIWALSDSMWSEPRPAGDGGVFPGSRAATSFRVFAPQADRAVRQLIRESLTSGLIYAPSGARDFENPEIDAWLRRYMPAANGSGHRERIKIIKLLWDAVGSEFAGRNELFELSNAGGPDFVRTQCLDEAARAGDLQRMSALLRRCLDDYDEYDWTFNEQPQRKENL